jgi:hypothetical protein
MRHHEHSIPTPKRPDDDKSIYAAVAAECRYHPPEPGYVVCLHISKGVLIAFRQDPTPESLGMILCAACLLAELSDTEQAGLMVLCCASCVRERLEKN